MIQSRNDSFPNRPSSSPTAVSATVNLSRCHRKKPNDRLRTKGTFNHNKRRSRNSSCYTWSWSALSLLVLASTSSSSEGSKKNLLTGSGPVGVQAFVPSSSSSPSLVESILPPSSHKGSTSTIRTTLYFRYTDEDETSAGSGNTATSSQNSILKNVPNSIRKKSPVSLSSWNKTSSSSSTATNASVSSIPSLRSGSSSSSSSSSIHTQTVASPTVVAAAEASKIESIYTASGDVSSPRTTSSFSIRNNGRLGSNTARKNDFQNDHMPSWLRPSGNHASEKLAHLREVMNNSQSYLSSLEAEQVISAIKEASGGNLRKIEGAVDFCLVLVETMEMGVATLIAAAFHYCDAYTARQQSATAQVECTTQFSHIDYWTQQKNEDCALDTRHDRAIKIGQDAHQLIMDSARIKRAEMVASESLRSRPSRTESSNIRKMLLSETHDWRALAIRSAACLYRLRGIYQHFEQEKRQNVHHTYSHHDIRVAREALEIHAPLASRLGMHRLKNEIEGGAFRILYRRQYEKITSLTHLNKPCMQEECAVSTFQDGMGLVLEKVTKELETLLENDPYFTKYVDQYKVSARIKESYSLWKKMKLKLNAKSILDVPDALALRVVFDAKKMSPDEDDEVTRARDRALCYYVQQACTKKFKPLQDGRFKDYIAHPKPNGYQSLHYTAVTDFENDKWPFEIQVRSGEMHHVAEFGLAAHWDYKAQESGDISPTDVSRAHYAFKLDNSSDAYLRSVQEWHWQQAQARSSWLTDSSSPHLYERDAEMTERLRARDERLAPYLDALKKDHSNLAREHVFIFMSCNDNDDGHVLELPAGACVLDALRESERSLGFTSNRMLEKQIVHNGSLTTVTQQLRNGDIITIPNPSTTITR